MTGAPPTMRDVARALLGTWPNQVAAWGQDGVQAYCGELAARGVTPGDAVAAIRGYDPDADFPPSAAKLAQVARRDPAAPTGLEVVSILWGPGGVMHARAPYATGGWRGQFARDEADDRARLDEAARRHPRVGLFIESVGLDALRARDPRSEQFGEANRSWVVREWDVFVSRADERGVAALLMRANVDPLVALRRARVAVARRGLVEGESVGESVS